MHVLRLFGIFLVVFVCLNGDCVFRQVDGLMMSLSLVMFENGERGGRESCNMLTSGDMTMDMMLTVGETEREADVCQWTETG